MEIVPWYVYLAWDDRYLWLSDSLVDDRLWLMQSHIQLCLFGSDS